MIDRLTKTLQPQRAAEEEAIEAAASTPWADLLVAMVERAVQHAWLSGAEVGRREVEEEHGYQLDTSLGLPVGYSVRTSPRVVLR